MSRELSPVHFPEAREIQSECGLAAVYLNRRGLVAGLSVSSILYQAGIDLQHRAEGSAGMMVSDGVKTPSKKDLGEVKSVFKQGRELPDALNPYIGLLHMRYPTSGNSNHEANIQPFKLDGVWLGHHGNLTNASLIEKKIGPIVKGKNHPDSDSWVALNAIVKAKGRNLGERVINAQREFEGGWVFIVTDGKTIVASRDPYGIRPLFIGHLGSEENPQGYALSVESCIFRNIKIRDYREILPGETIRIDKKGAITLDVNRKGELSCIFEFVYMMHPDSRFLGQLVHETRRKAGEILWREAPVTLRRDEKLRVVPVPNSGRPSALGFFNEAREALGYRVDYEEGLLTNAYYGRNFIKPTSGRDAKKKFYTVPYLIEGKTIALVDDSIVRGDTTQALVEMLLEAGAKEVHVRVASPEINNPCYLGVAFGTHEELFTHKVLDLKEREKILRASSLKHLSLKGLVEAVGITSDRLCTHCFDGKKLPFEISGVVPLKEN